MNPLRSTAWICGAALLLATGAFASPPEPPTSILVKLRAEGPHAIHACAEASFRSRRSLAAASEDGSDSLDRLESDLGVRSVRAVFRRPDGAPFATQRERLRSRLRSAFAMRGRRRMPERLPDLAHVYRLELPPGVSVTEAVERFRADAHVAYAQANDRVDLDLSLDDPFLASSGTWGQPYPDQWGLYAIDAPSAWSTSLGEGVVIGVVDTGVDLVHPDIVENLWVNPGEDLNGNGVIDPEDHNGIDDDGNGFVDDLRGWDFQGSPEDGTGAEPGGEPGPGDAEPQDEEGHGTHVAGIAAARGGNGIGIAGVAPRATVMPVRVFSPSGSAEDALVWRGVLYAVLNGADVINASFSCGRVCRSQPVAEDVLAIAEELGVAYVTSAGNEAADVLLKSPERLRASIVVGSVDPSGELAATSSFGYLVDVVAPGDDILSLAAPAARRNYAPFRFVGNDYLRLSGTSMAAPHVSGVIALLLSADPTLTPEDLRALLHATARDLGDPGPDPRFGRGMVQPAAALALGRAPDLRGEIQQPLPGDTLDGEEEEAPIVGSVLGSDVTAYRLEIGAGEQPVEWTPIETRLAPPFEALEFARLSLRTLSDGPHVLRLTLTGRDGAETSEFTPVGIERNRPAFLSPEDGDARNPDLEGVRVVWEDHLPEEIQGTPGSRVRIGRFGREANRLLASSSDDQRLPTLSSWGAAWLETRSEGPPIESDLFFCRLLASGRCLPRRVRGEPAFRERPQLSGRNLLVLETRDGVRSLQACRVASSGCTLGRVAPDISNPEFPVLDGSRIVFGTSEGLGLYTCLLDPSASACPPVPIALSETFYPRALALSGRLLAYTGLTGQGQRLFLCELTDASGCAPVIVTGLPVDYRGSADLSGRRVTWEAAGAFGEPDVYYCEFDARAGRCPVQRVTSDAASQSHPRIDGSRLVWEDLRNGNSRIASFALPTIVSPRFGTVREGTLLTIGIRIHGTERAAISASTRDGQALSALGIELSQRSQARAQLRWRPASDQVGTYELVLRATLPGGLYTERSLTLEVIPRKRGQRPPQHER